METTNPSIDTFVDRLLDEKGLSGLDKDVLAQAKADLGNRVEMRLNAAILDNMPEDQLQAFDKVLDTGSQKDIQTFCARHIRNLEDVIARELLEFRQTYLGV